jgi:hypothetical protein
MQFQTMRFDDLASVSDLTMNPCKDTKRIRSGLESGAKQGRGWETKLWYSTAVLEPANSRSCATRAP